MTKKLSGKTALVGGSSKGLGYGSAEELAKLGCEIVLVGRSVDLLQEKLVKIDALNGLSNSILVADYTQLDQVTAKVQELVSDKAIHILINNCGGPPPGKLIEAEIDALKLAFQMHILTSQAMTKLVVPGMRAAGYGRIINIVSTSIRQPIMGLGVSNTIRGAMGSWSKTMALELAPDAITVNIW